MNTDPGASDKHNMKCYGHDTYASCVTDCMYEHPYPLVFVVAHIKFTNHAWSLPAHVSLIQSKVRNCVDYFYKSIRIYSHFR